jgi:hypothetical protein
MVCVVNMIYAASRLSDSRCRTPVRTVNTDHGRILVMPTGKKAASEAGKVLADPKATKAEKAAAASDLAQAPDKGKK